MWTSNCKLESKLGKDYLVTEIYKDGVMVKCTYELVENVKVLEQKNIFEFLKKLAEQKLNVLNQL
jgi:hypothetical protein